MVSNGTMTIFFFLQDLAIFCFPHANSSSSFKFSILSMPSGWKFTRIPKQSVKICFDAKLIFIQSQTCKFSHFASDLARWIKEEIKIFDESQTTAAWKTSLQFLSLLFTYILKCGRSQMIRSPQLWFHGLKTGEWWRPWVAQQAKLLHTQGN